MALFNINTLDMLKITGKRVFLRADLNVPLKNGSVLDDFKIKALLPTLNKLQTMQPSHIILATHIGRPTHKDDSLSTRHLVPLLKHYNFDVKHISKLDSPDLQSKDTNKPILLLENLRFFSDETDQTKSQIFAKKLAQLADVYINDAFAAMHRNNASISALPALFPPQSRGVGLLVAHEIQELTKLKNQAIQPFIVVIGGAKLASKLPLLSELLELPKTLRPTKIIIGGMLAHAFLKANDSYNTVHEISDEALQNAHKIIKLANANNVKLVLPKDHIEDDNCHKCDIGPKTIQLFCNALKDGQKLFLNGTMGMYENKKFALGTKAICTAISQLKGCFKVVGGGDAVATIRSLNLDESFELLSTGGGATLAFLAARQPQLELPGLAALTNR